MLWLHIHGKGDITPRGLTLMKLLSVFRIPTRVSVYSPTLAALYSAGFPGQVVEMPGSPINETISKMITEKSIYDLVVELAVLMGKLFAFLQVKCLQKKRYSIFEDLLSTADKRFS